MKFFAVSSIILGSTLVIALLIGMTRVVGLTTLRTQVVPNSAREATLQGVVRTAVLSPGSHYLEIVTKTQQSDLNRREVWFSVRGAAQPPPPTGGNSGGGGGGSSGGGGGGGGGGGSKSAPAAPEPTGKAYPFQVEKGHALKGQVLKAIKDGTRTVVVLRGPNAVLSKAIKVPTGNYWLELTAKDDQPGPVKVRVELNNKKWKEISFAKNDNKYRTLRVGLLRKFKGGTITFTLLNDTFDKNNPNNEKTDRNLVIDSWRLVSEK